MESLPTLLADSPPDNFTHQVELLAPMAGKVCSLNDTGDIALQSGVWGNGVAISTRSTVCSVPFDGSIEKADLTAQRWILKATNGLRVMIQIGTIASPLYAERLQVQLKPKQKFNAGQVLAYLDPVWLVSKLGQLHCTVTILNSKHISAIVPTKLGTQIDAMEGLMKLYLHVARTKK